jgi:hypothetical protein
MAHHLLMKLETLMICVRLNTLPLCLAILGRIILTAGLILCFGPIVQGANAQNASQSPAATFNCSSGFAATGSCGVSLIGYSGQPFGIVGSQNGSSPGLSGSQVELVPGGAGHVGLNLNYQTAVNVQSFSSTFTFIPNGWNISFVLNNNNNTGLHPNDFGAGAGCEGSFFQGFVGSAPNNVFALELDSYSPLTQNGSFTYSSVQYYTPGVFASNAPNPPGQSPCNPNLGGTNFTYASVTKVSTSPVNLTTGSALTTTGHVYSATVTYDGSNVSISLYDVTAGGSCPGSNCFTHTWNNVNIPSIVGGNTAYVGLAGGTNETVPNALLINSFGYSSPYSGSRGALSGTHDFNGDGKSDIVWRDTSNDASSGALVIWEMNGTQVLNPGSSSFVATASYPQWTIIGTGDFNGDGYADVLWRDTTNDIALWEMKGTQITNANTTFVANVPGWSIVGIGDFNGDGKSDLLWADQKGDYTIWEMNGTQILNTGATYVATISTDWNVAGVGDFNGDGKSDILWRDQKGDYAIWEMNGTQILNTGATYVATVTGWSVVGTGDYNGDGKSDILWTDGNGNYAIWEMNGTTVTNSNATHVANVSANWAVQLPLGQ